MICLDTATTEAAKVPVPQPAFTEALKENKLLQSIFDIPVQS